MNVQAPPQVISREQGSPTRPLYASIINEEEVIQLDLIQFEEIEG